MKGIFRDISYSSTVLFFLTFPFSLLQEVKADNISFSDTTMIDSLLDYGYELEFRNPDSAIDIYKKASELSSLAGDILRQGKAHNYMGIVFSDIGDYNRALRQNEFAIDLFEQVGYQTGIAACKINIGNIKMYFGEYDEAVSLYYEGLASYEKIKDTTRLLLSLNNIGTLFYENDYLDEAINYYSRAIKLARFIPDKTILADAHLNLANTLRLKGDTDGYLHHLDSAIIHSESLNYSYGRVLIYLTLSEYYIEINKPDSALSFSRKLLKNAKEYGNPYNIAEAYNRFGIALMENNKIDSAGLFFHKAAEISQKNGYKQVLANSRLNIANHKKHQGNFREAFKSLFEYQMLIKEISTEEKQQALQELDRKYQLVRKERQIQDQRASLIMKENEIKQKNTAIIIGTVALVLAVIILILLYIILRNRKRIQEKELQRMHSERDKEVIKALLEGEEKERKRIARELHDGINGNLAALKMNLGDKKDSEYNVLLDQTMNEVRNISHNLMPDMVQKFGLKEALENYISSLERKGSVKIHFQFIPEDVKLHQELSINIYRITQELIKNSLTHSEAKEILIQLTLSNEIIQLTVEDDGKGFRTTRETRGSGSGIGLRNVENRVKYFRGKLDIKSSTHTGTSVNIEIPLTQSLIQ
mgnify:CR=1 FL=1